MHIIRAIMYYLIILFLCFLLYTQFYRHPLSIENKTGSLSLTYEFPQYTIQYQGKKITAFYGCNMSFLNDTLWFNNDTFVWHVKKRGPRVLKAYGYSHILHLTQRWTFIAHDHEIDWRITLSREQPYPQISAVHSDLFVSPRFVQYLCYEEGWQKASFKPFSSSWIEQWKKNIPSLLHPIGVCASPEKQLPCIRFINRNNPLFPLSIISNTDADTHSRVLMFHTKPGEPFCVTPENPVCMHFSIQVDEAEM